MEKKINKEFTVTSNLVKLYKHFDELQSFQDGKSKPIMVHLMLTNQCNLNCSTCCFASSNNDGKYLDVDYVKDIMSQFKTLGTKAVELTGGGDPTCYKHLDEIVNFLFDNGFSIGMNTNGILNNKYDFWDKFSWIRLSMNSLDKFPEEKVHHIQHIRSGKSPPDVTGCYVWNELGPKNINMVIEYANRNKIITRVVPNCITTKDDIDKQMEEIHGFVDNYVGNEFVFVSDFNIDTGQRKNNNCYVHHIKPCVFTDGYVYSCPSSELSVENGITLKPEFRICKGDEVSDYYQNHFEVKERNCYYCKYKQQNEFLENLLIPTKHNEFA